MGVITPKTILTKVCAAFEIDDKLVKGKQRVESICMVRHIYCYTACYYYDFSKSSVGREINRHHTSVMHSVSAVQDWIKIGDTKCMGAIKVIEDTLQIKIEKTEMVTIPKTEYDEMIRELEDMGHKKQDTICELHNAIRELGEMKRRIVTY